MINFLKRYYEDAFNALIKDIYFNKIFSHKLMLILIEMNKIWLRKLYYRFPIPNATLVSIISFHNIYIFFDFIYQLHICIQIINLIKKNLIQIIWMLLYMIELIK